MSDIFTPFEPDPEPGRRRFRPVPLRLLVPNMVTLLALASGLTAIRFANEARFDHAVLAIALAAVLDGLDGRLARLLNGTSRFGAELDSLADFVSFGVAPAIVLYFWNLSALSTMGWLAVLALACAAALRLARFNVMIDGPERPDWQKMFFVGVPAPAGAMLALLPVLIVTAGVPAIALPSVLVAIWTVLVAGLMVSRVPTFSGKGLSGPVPRQRVVPLMGLAVALAALLASHPFATIAVLTALYAGALPLAALRYRNRQRRDSAVRASLEDHPGSARL